MQEDRCSSLKNRQMTLEISSSQPSWHTATCSAAHRSGPTEQHLPRTAHGDLRAAPVLVRIVSLPRPQSPPRSVSGGDRDMERRRQRHADMQTETCSR